MKLSFDIDRIKFLKIKFVNNFGTEIVKFALKSKSENSFTAVTPEFDTSDMVMPQRVSIDFICHDGIYKTDSDLMSIYNLDGNTYFVIHNPETINYQENRNLYRVLAKCDCIYTVETDEGMQSFDVCSYDLSPGAISIISDEMVVSRKEMSILIILPHCNIRTHLKFIRCELHNDGYKLAFEFTDISEKDAQVLSEFCISKQLNSH